MDNSTKLTFHSSAIMLDSTVYLSLHRKFISSWSDYHPDSFFFFNAAFICLLIPDFCSMKFKLYIAKWKCSCFQLFSLRHYFPCRFLKDRLFYSITHRVSQGQEVGLVVFLLNVAPQTISPILCQTFWGPAAFMKCMFRYPSFWNSLQVFLNLSHLRIHLLVWDQSQTYILLGHPLKV